MVAYTVKSIFIPETTTALEYTFNEKKIEPGQISGWIANETGYSQNRVLYYLEERFKNPINVETGKQGREIQFDSPSQQGGASVELDAVIKALAGRALIDLLMREF
ncbi:hypothetical protein MCGE09_00035 [Thaumarchaeota archaeon SCGC AB-539-E09]|nr:hypothetical protein MCGE09_00035 [Thaumarchaeota archaeon SCGC AB-539-E09]